MCTGTEGSTREVSSDVDEMRRGTYPTVPAMRVGIIVSKDGLRIVSVCTSQKLDLAHNWMSASRSCADRLFATIDEALNLPPRIFAYVFRLSFTYPKKSAPFQFILKTTHLVERRIEAVSLLVRFRSNGRQRVRIRDHLRPIEERLDGSGGHEADENADGDREETNDEGDAPVATAYPGDLERSAANLHDQDLAAHHYEASNMKLDDWGPLGRTDGKDT